MSVPQARRGGALAFVGPAALFGLVAIGIVILLVAGVEATRALSYLLLGAVVLAVVLTAIGWILDRRRLTQLATETGEAVESIGRERELRGRLERARRAERAWSKELREQLMTMHRDRGALGQTDDVRELVLRISVQLVEAEKGLLLSREDRDGDGRLDLIASHGFHGDPAHSAVAQRFSREVIERDTAIREDDAAQLEGAAEADDEIRNLVAIPIYMHDEFSGAVVCANRPGGFAEFDDEVLLSLGDQAGAVLQSSRLQGELRTSYLATVRMLGETLEAKDPLLRGHSEDVSTYVAAVADRLGIGEERRERLVFGSLLHDVGKIGVSERILLKPGPLTREERAVCELHPRIGYHLIQQVPALREMAPAILHHHERFDGGGYPSGLAGDQIPLEARVVCVADSFSAMTAERPYKAPVSVDEACAELERCAGTQFDPEVVRVFVAAVRERPPKQNDGALSPLLSDPEIAVRRNGDEPVLGASSFAATDNLTLLYSHRHLHEMAANEAERAAVQQSTFSVVVVELNDLNELNRRDGYAAGDEAIRGIARALDQVAAREGGTAARLSGRRLGMIVPGAGEEDAARVADDVVREIGAGARVSTGCATWSPGELGHDVIERARSGLRAAVG